MTIYACKIFMVLVRIFLSCEDNIIVDFRFLFNSQNGSSLSNVEVRCELHSELRKFIANFRSTFSNSNLRSEN